MVIYVYVKGKKLPLFLKINYFKNSFRKSPNTDFQTTINLPYKYETT